MPSAVNDRYNYRTFAEEDLSEAEGFSDTIIGSCFAQREPFTDCLPADARATFVRCNLDNCNIPQGCTVGDGCCNDHHRIQNDGGNWIIDNQGNPLRPLDEAEYDEFGLSKDPRDIPAQPVKESLISVGQRKASARGLKAELLRQVDELDVIIGG